MDDLLFLWASGPTSKEPTSNIHRYISWSAKPSALARETASPCSGYQLVQRLRTGQNVASEWPLSTQSLLGHLYHHLCLPRGSGNISEDGVQVNVRARSRGVLETGSSGRAAADVLQNALQWGKGGTCARSIQRDLSTYWRDSGGPVGYDLFKVGRAEAGRLL